MSIKDYLYFILLPILAFSVLLVFYRFLRGPSIIDRVVALDLIITIGITIIAVYAVVYEESTLLDIAMILGLIAFLSSVAFAYYLEKSKKPDKTKPTRQERNKTQADE